MIQHQSTIFSAFPHYPLGALSHPAGPLHSTSPHWPQRPSTGVLISLVSQGESPTVSSWQTLKASRQIAAEGLCKDDFSNQIKGQINYPGSNLNQIKVQTNIWAKFNVLIIMVQYSNFLLSWRPVANQRILTDSSQDVSIFNFGCRK